MGHTPGPWRLGKQYGAVVADAPVPEVRGSDDVEAYGGHMVAESVSKANARRIVAAVNATEGIPTEALESGVIGELATALERIHNEAKSEFGMYEVSDLGKEVAAVLRKTRGEG